MADEHAATSVALPRSVRVAGALVVLVGVANLAVGLVALAGGDEVATGVAAGLAAAGAAAAVLGWFVWQGRPRAVYLALVVFELLLIPRLLTLGEPGTGAWASLVLLIGIVAALWVATLAIRRGRARSDDAGATSPEGVAL